MTTIALSDGRPLRVAFMGTRGVPAHYGGFETAVEEVGRRLAAAGHDVVVYCRNGNSGQKRDPDRYLGMQLVHLPASRRKSLETLSHTILSALHAWRTPTYDAVIVCNAANSLVLPLLHLRGIPVAVHVDGLEWRRAKWGPLGKMYYRVAESLAVRWGDALIADAQGIERYYAEEFGAQTAAISHGAPDGRGFGQDRLAELGIAPQGYHLIVARFEPENHVDMMLDGYLRSSSGLPLVIVGSAPYSSEYTAKIQQMAAGRDNVKLVGGVFDQELLDQLYGGALTYLHGHSVGGTNPSLLRAMGAATLVIAYDIIFNREVAGSEAFYAGSAGEVADALQEAEAYVDETMARGESLARRARDHYTWDDVAERFQLLFLRLAKGESQRGLYTGRRAKRSPWKGVNTPRLTWETTRPPLTTTPAPKRRAEATDNPAVPVP